jgi:hypothetical protein
MYYIYRTNFVQDIFEAYNYVQNGRITIDYIVEKNINFLVPIGAFIMLKKNFNKILYNKIL